jgi:glutamine amidotransferase
MIALIDYGMGNIHSVKKALELFGAKTFVTDNPDEIKRSEKIVLPGVGAFLDAIQELERRGIAEVIKDEIKDKKPFLGICLGMQLLFEESQEAKDSKGLGLSKSLGLSKGLGLLKGVVMKFPSRPGFKVPHMGWNQIKFVLPACPLIKGIPENSYVYFCHSYYPQPKDKNIIACQTDYIEEFASLVWQENIFGVQFHPEKSQAAGLKILENFVKLCS